MQTGSQPILIIGMHRSGTSLLTRILSESGVFLGRNREGNDESEFFLWLNEWMYKEIGASWDNVDNFKFADDNYYRRVSNVLESKVDSMLFRYYTGFKRHKVRYDSSFVWGWKDPRNTFAVRAWDKVFPGAKIIHIYRHPIDVVKSLMVRAHETASRPLSFRQKIKETLLLGRVQYCQSYRVKHADEALKLWSDYVAEGIRSRDLVGQRRYFAISAESLILDPHRTLKSIFDFLGLDVALSDKVKLYLNSVDETRAFAYKNEEAHFVSDLLKNNSQAFDLAKSLGYCD